MILVFIVLGVILGFHYYMNITMSKLALCQAKQQYTPLAKMRADEYAKRIGCFD